MHEENEAEREPESSRYIEFSHGKLGILRIIKWDPALGEPEHGRRFLFRDEFGEDWGIVYQLLTEPPDIPQPQETDDADEEEPDDAVERIVDGIVLRYFTSEDDEALAEIVRDEGKYLETCRERVEHHGLKMKMLATDIRFDRRKITFHFAAEGRVDFRMLVRDLASIFRCRIELHQIGARDEAKLYVGCGPCGRTICCRAWLEGFQPIGIKMARAQNLPLNPGKISGNCGRLLCCLSYEFENYLELGKTLPKVGDQKEIDGIPFEVTHVSPLNQMITMQCLQERDRHKRIRISGEEYEAGSAKRRK